MRHRQRAQATVWLILMTFVLGLMFGLIADGAVLFGTHRRAEQLADSAARAAASALDQTTLRGGSVRAPRLDPVAARAVAVRYVLDQDTTAGVEATATPDTITVDVHLHAATTIAHPPGRSTVDVVAEGYAHPVAGLATPDL
jgi:hypothetical protein